MTINKMDGSIKNNLVIGLGQIGTAIQAILNCDAQDKEIIHTGHYDVLHICIPALDNFIEIVEEYKRLYTPDLVIVHATVPVGTCKKLNAVHSPCRGIHPNLKEGIETFVKYFGGEKAEEASKIFADKGIKVKCVANSDTVEALKLWDTTIYGWNILLEKEIYKYCQEKGLDFDLIYTDANTTYNQGYDELGHPEYKKYVLKHYDEPLKGHCILENCVLLKDSGIDSGTIDNILSLGKHKDVISESKPYLNKTWFYCEHWGKKRNLRDIAKEFDVSGENISQIAHRNGWMVRSSKWTEVANNKLIQLSKEYTFKQISDLIDRSYNSIRTQAIKLGLKSIYKPAEETKKDLIRKKISASLQGIDLNEWVGFVETENAIIRKSVEYKKWRSDVFTRDNYKCSRCGATGYLEADHIKPFCLYPELRFELDNGQTLCKECHSLKTKEDFKIINQYRNASL